jgi:hypothetical protein
MAMVRYPLPITPAMLAPANPRVDYPRYSTAADWNQGASGADIYVSTATSPKVGAEGVNANALPPVTPATQAARVAANLPTYAMTADIGADYGPYKGSAGRTGVIDPYEPYPDVTSPPTVVGVTPNTGPAAGGTAITISGQNLTGATLVTIGGTAATSVVVVNSNTITAASPVKVAGPPCQSAVMMCAASSSWATRTRAGGKG